MRNIELKARLADLEAARRVAVELHAVHQSTQLQVDTYFVCHQGRLKLREIEFLGSAQPDPPTQLVWYARPDQSGPKASDYQLVPVVDSVVLKAALTSALGIRAVVRKRREVHLDENVRIHLDEVDALGTFLEFEAVLSPEMDDTQGELQLERLIAAFSLSDDMLITGSYVDLLEHL